MEEQFAAFMEGFGEVVPLELIKVFDENEVELLIGGMSEIDMCVSRPHCHPFPALWPVLTVSRTKRI